MNGLTLAWFSVARLALIIVGHSPIPRALSTAAATVRADHQPPRFVGGDDQIGRHNIIGRLDRDGPSTIGTGPGIDVVLTILTSSLS
jgi:hypothetical protein